MPYLLFGAVLLVIVLLGRDALLKADPKTLAKHFRPIGGYALLIFAFILLVTGRVLQALPFAVIGYLLIGASPFSLPGDASMKEGSGRHFGSMSRDEAYSVLGLEPGASREEILHTHRILMTKIHPDHGGSTYLASKLNEAKDTLL